jgi:RNA-splicing ligase RtcB
MRDGSLICLGKGNDDWNCSCIHVAGRIYSRTKAKEILKLNEFENDMKKYTQ